MNSVWTQVVSNRASKVDLPCSATIHQVYMVLLTKFVWLFFISSGHLSAATGTRGPLTCTEYYLTNLYLKVRTLIVQTLRDTWNHAEEPCCDVHPGESAIAPPYVRMNLIQKNSLYRLLTCPIISRYVLSRRDAFSFQGFRRNKQSSRATVIYTLIMVSLKCIEVNELLGRLVVLFPRQGLPIHGHL